MKYLNLIVTISLFFVVALACDKASAQKLTLTVKNNQTEKVIPGATVKLYDSKHREIVSKITGEDGAVLIQLNDPGRYTIETKSSSLIADTSYYVTNNTNSDLIVKMVIRLDSKKAK